LKIVLGLTGIFPQKSGVPGSRIFAGGSHSCLIGRVTRVLLLLPDWNIIGVGGKNSQPGWQC
jgi:hypothetical protein